jgi:hypothetical protein
MKFSPRPALLRACLVMVACFLFSPLTAIAADAPYRAETHGPRIATRIMLFFKDLAYGDNPNDRYRQSLGSQPPGMTRQPAYGNRAPGPRYNLDHPPADGGMPVYRQPQFANEPPITGRKPAVQDAPYNYLDAPTAAERNNHQPRVGDQKEDMPPVNSKPKRVAAQKQVAPSKPMAEEPPARSIPNRKFLPQETLVQESTPPTSTASSPRKSWQPFGGDSTRNTPATPQTTVENKSPAPPPVVSSSNTTLTGSKTTKEGRVKSPYAPFNELDVTGLPAGSLAMDPTTGKVFRVP